MEIREFFSQAIGLTDDDLIDKVDGISQIVSFEKGDLIVRQGEIQKHIYFVLEGIFRGYYVNREGKEITDCLGFRCGEPAMACTRLDGASEICIESATDSKCLQMPIKKTIELIGEYPELENAYNKLLVQGIKRHNEIKRVLLDYDSAGRYQWFLEAYPDLIDVIGHKYIASFLGMMPESLSRLRRTLREGGTSK